VTVPGSRRIQIFSLLLGLFEPGRLIDLGAGHSVAAAKAGWEVTAVDARTDRNATAPGVTWVQADVRDIDLGGYDVVGCLGLFCHLTVEDQIDLLARCQSGGLHLVSAGPHLLRRHHWFASMRRLVPELVYEIRKLGLDLQYL
jgi:2-polyprenyl-3-methyl-5-hydroxy-6-metoxy-1,4-benzoquinol methylase